MDQRPLERVWVGYFLFHRTLKIPSSVNKPVPGSKILGKWSERKREILNHGWLVNLFYYISYLDYHFNVCFFPVQKDRFLTVYVWCCGLVTEIFLFIMRSGFVLLNVSRQDLCHIANDLLIWNILQPVSCYSQRPVSFVFKLTYFLLHFFKPSVFSFIWLE